MREQPCTHGAGPGAYKLAIRQYAAGRGWGERETETAIGIYMRELSRGASPAAAMATALNQADPAKPPRDYVEIRRAESPPVWLYAAAACLVFLLAGVLAWLVAQ